mmetsp:Transcript_102223/g.329809  ORF Transcript_102223/g.329809 Transcript_102223/m.329809 type:complete len:365 (-) Transcript_102223:584-1678(-)
MPSVGKIQDADVKDTRWCARLDQADPAKFPYTRRTGSLALPTISSADVANPSRGFSLGSKTRRSQVEMRLLPAPKVAWEAADRSPDSCSSDTNGARRPRAKSEGGERAWLPVLGGRSDGDDHFDCPPSGSFENPFAGASFSDYGSDIEPSTEELDRDVSLQAQEADGDRRARLLEPDLEPSTEDLDRDVSLQAQEADGDRRARLLELGRIFGMHRDLKPTFMTLGAEQLERELRKARNGWETPDDDDLDARRLEYSGTQGRQRLCDIRHSSHGSAVRFALSAHESTGELGRSLVEGVDSTGDRVPLPHTVQSMNASELDGHCFSTDVAPVGFQTLQSERCTSRTFKDVLGVTKKVLRLAKISTC